MIGDKMSNIVAIDDIVNKLNSSKMAIREEELLRIYGNRYKIYREQYKLAGEFKFRPDFPLYIMPEQTYRCNLKCKSCIHGYPDLRDKYSFSPDIMPWDLYERIILEGEEHGCPAISTHNNDEPLLIKDLAKRISLAKKHGFMDVILTTNGTLFTNDKIKEVIDAGVTRILFSIDAYKPETYRTLRGGDLNKVRSALFAAISYRDKSCNKLPIIRVSFVVNSINQFEVKPFIDEYVDIVDYIDVQPLLGLKNYNDELVSVASKKVDVFKCNSAWRRIVIRGNGDVLPCENFLGAGMIIGNLYKDTIFNIFNSEVMESIRQEGFKGSYSNKYCNDCSQNIYYL
jgi:radical SAM protein with 4Fe4S-binding SPASM domain